MTQTVREVRSEDHIGCWTDRYITVAGRLCLLSLFGSPTRVRTLKAVILKGEPVYLQDCWTGKNRRAAQRPHRQIKAISRQLASGVAHCLLFVPEYLNLMAESSPWRVFFGDSWEEVMDKFFHAAQKYYSTPLLPTWRNWLWEQMDALEEVESWGFNLAQGVKFIEEDDLETRLLAPGSPLR